MIIPYSEIQRRIDDIDAGRVNAVPNIRQNVADGAARIY